MKSLFNLFLVLICTTMCSNLFAQHCKTKWMDGDWAGVGYQEDAMNQNSWSVDLNYNFKGKTISINYPSFPCGGSWKLEKANKNKAIFTEVLSSGKTLCQDGGRVIVTKIDKNFITVTYFNESQSAVVAFSTLTKQN